MKESPSRVFFYLTFFLSVCFSDDIVCLSVSSLKKRREKKKKHVVSSLSAWEELQGRKKKGSRPPAWD